MLVDHFFKDIRKLTGLSELYDQTFRQIPGTHADRIESVYHFQDFLDLILRSICRLCYLLYGRSHITVFIKRLYYVFADFKTCLLAVRELKLEQQMFRQRKIRRRVLLVRILLFFPVAVFPLSVAYIVILSVFYVFFPVKIIVLAAGCTFPLIHQRFFLTLGSAVFAAVTPRILWCISMCLFKDRIRQKLLLHIRIEFLRIELQDLDRLYKLRSHYQLLRLLNF